MKEYYINIFYSDVDKGYITDIPDLETCSPFGKTAAEALTGAIGEEGLVRSGPRRMQTPSPSTLPACDL